jgi:hypothetical protein
VHGAVPASLTTGWSYPGEALKELSRDIPTRLSIGVFTWCRRFVHEVAAVELHLVGLVELVLVHELFGAWLPFEVIVHDVPIPIAVQTASRLGFVRRRRTCCCGGWDARGGGRGVAFLASPEASYITGETLGVSGDMVLGTNA